MAAGNDDTVQEAAKVLGDLAPPRALPIPSDVPRAPARPASPETSAPPRNFTLTAADRARAAISGPPAWSVRLRRIETTEQEIVDELVALAAEDGAVPGVLPPWLARRLEALNALIAAHNAYYPIEANLPSDPLTRAVLDGGKPWVRMDRRSAAALIAEARVRFVDEAEEP